MPALHPGHLHAQTVLLHRRDAGFFFFFFFFFAVAVAVILIII